MSKYENESAFTYTSTNGIIRQITRSNENWKTEPWENYWRIVYSNRSIELWIQIALSYGNKNHMITTKLTFASLIKKSLVTKWVIC